MEYDLVAARRTVALGETSSKLGDDRPGEPSVGIRTRVENALECSCPLGQTQFQAHETCYRPTLSIDVDLTPTPV